MRRLLADPVLSGVGLVVLDEFHERSLDADLALAMLRRLRAGARPDLRLVVMSATLDAEPVAAFLGGVRFLFELTFPDFHSKRLDWLGVDQIIPNSPDLETGFAFLDQYVVVIFLGSLLVGAAYGWFYYVRHLEGKRTVTPLSVWRQLRRRK